jgi:ABC-2 type transport system ATP-binding protein
MPKSARQHRADELLDFAELRDRADDIAKRFSGGMQRRLMLMKALMHNPDVLLLDEPTVGLDPAARRKLWSLLRRLHKNGLTVFLTTHYIEEAAELCSRVAVLNHGRLVCADTPDAIVAQTQQETLEDAFLALTHLNEGHAL